MTDRERNEAYGLAYREAIDTLRESLETAKALHGQADSRDDKMYLEGQIGGIQFALDLHSSITQAIEQLEARL